MAPKTSKKETKKGKKRIKKKKGEFNINPKELMEIGVHLGHKTSKFHPKMKPYILGVKKTVHLIDPKKTIQKLEQALKFIEKIISEGKALLLVGTKPHLRKPIQEVAEECELFYVTERWLGGTFTNFETISKRLDYLRDLEEKREKGEFEKYTKKEQLDIDREIKKLQRKFKGIKTMEELPNAVFIFDIRNDNLAVREAKKKDIKIIGLVDTNVDPSSIDYPIPANDDALSSIKYMLEKIKKVVKKAKLKKKENSKT